MIIRKLFKFEGSHIVRDCTTKRCSENIHGHSYKVEILLESDKLDNGGMVVDFGVIKNSIIGRFLDAFDHTHLLWKRDTPEIIGFITETNRRWIIMPLNPTAENIALTILGGVHYFLGIFSWENGEGGVKIHSVIVHETDTGYAQAFPDDMKNINQANLLLDYSDELLKELKA